MKTLFRDLINLALFEDAAGLVFLADIDYKEELNTQWQIEELEDWFPDSCLVKMLGSGEDFLKDLENEFDQVHSKQVFLFPPFIRRSHLSQGFREQYPGYDLHEAAAIKLANVVPSGTRVGITLPIVSLRTRRSGRFRANLFKNSRPEIIITHQRPVLLTDTIVQMGTLILEMGKSDPAPVKFFKECEEQDLIADFKRLLRQGGGRTEYGYVRREPLPAESPLIFERYHPDLIAQREDMRYFGKVRPLSDLVDIREGLKLHFLNRKEGVLSEADTDGIPIITGRSIREDGVLDFGKPRRYLLKKELMNLQSGDLCLRAFIHQSLERLPVVEITESDLPLAANDSVIVLRPRKDTSTEDRELLVAFLRSSQALEFLIAEGADLRAFPSYLSQIPVPVPDRALTLSIRSLNKAIERFDFWRKMAAQERSRLFSLFDEYTSSKDARLHLLSTGRTARQRVEAAQRVTEFAHRVRTQYPHPIAYRWRRLQAGRPDSAGYQQLLDCAETTLCYLAFIVLTFTRYREDVSIGYQSVMAKRLSSNRSRGTNMGDWIAILREARDSRQFSAIEDLVPFYEALHFLRKDSVDSALQDLKDRRDDSAHGRGPTEVTIEEEFRSAYEQLEMLLSATEFVAEYPLRFIEVTRRDSLRAITDYEYRDLMGDHPLVPIASGQTKLPELEAHSLYLVDRSGDLYLLRPFLIRERCPTCGRWATFFLDTYDVDSDCCTLKSLEVGHTVESYDIAPALRYVGLLHKTD